MAEGVSDQRGATFGFAPKSNDDTGTILKGWGVSQANRRKPVNSSIHNVSKEWNVGFINYETSLRGKQYLETTSRRISVNKSSRIFDQGVSSD